MNHDKKKSSRKRQHNRATFNDLTHPNFEELSRQYPAFGTALSIVKQQQKELGGSFASNVTPEFSTATTRALLHCYFQMSLPNIPSLCPPIPNRFFLVKWILGDLMPLMERPGYFISSESTIAGSNRTGIDLGTGATCIYPLLACADVNLEDYHPIEGSWKWFASEVDSTSVEAAKENVVANNLNNNSIEVVKVQLTDRQQQDSDDCTMDDHAESPKSGPLKRLLEELPSPPTLVDVVLTNPPFHATDADQVTQSHRKGDQRLKTPLTHQEASYPGGEVMFITDLIVDALTLQPTFSSKWYACMLGKKSSWNQLKGALLHLLGPARVQFAEFGPGHLTRWFLAWTFEKANIRSPLALFKSSGTKHTFEVTLSSGDNAIKEVAKRIETYFRTHPHYKLVVETSNAGTTLATVSAREVSFSPEEWSEKSLPVEVCSVIQNRGLTFLPEEGHFLVEATIQSKHSKTAVSVKAFAHSQYGQIAVNKLGTHLQPEVCRTNRKWRRILARQQQQTISPQPMEE